ncbi:GGDEF domain-containing protein [Psychromonas sp. Urea-02u-13]|uniref:GGDEF domain-containing protein n=1 Tax=Psychromonas sp. Urea-02u-13 TaxID=2058326 RepID=UPI000C34015B|nr:GGDEF domain-containing protein [Psychromonas sp. Urea-02u-13]PKG40270.1 GGDEF domain-containing protein [Psychromonas sp. Urea-02u-13]
MNSSLLMKSAANLKKALPLMMKYKVPTTPVNYALWYTYVSDELPELNEQLNDLMANNDICPPIQAESLYRDFVASKTDSETLELRTSIDKMLIQLDKSLIDTHKDTNTFQKAFEKTFDDINSVEQEGLSVEEVIGLVKKLQGDSKNMHRSTAFFSKSLENAKGEIASLKAQLEKSQKLALYDSLTGLLNRHAFDTELSAYLEKNNQGLCLVLADIDHFKNFNDQWGHLLGDQVLKAVGRKLNDSMRNGASAYRFGGEEFAILIPKSKLRIARHFAESIRKVIEKLTLKDKRTGEKINNVTISLGVVEFQQGDSLHNFITRADEFLYEAKRLGRNRVLPIL